MEPKFQNAFIPKRPVVTAQSKVATTSRRRKHTFFGILTTLVFIAALVATGGVFGYTKFLENDIFQKDLLLQEERNALEPELIDELAIVDAQLQIAEDVLSDHLAPSRFFEHLESMTLQKVQFGSFSYNAGPGSMPQISISGIAPDYETVALQSDIFAQDESINQALFSGLNLTEEGDVSFEVSAEVSNRLTSYKQ